MIGLGRITLTDAILKDRVFAITIDCSDSGFIEPTLVYKFILYKQGCGITALQQEYTKFKFHFELYEDTKDRCEFEIFLEKPLTEIGDKYCDPVLSTRFKATKYNHDNEIYTLIKKELEGVQE